MNLENIELKPLQKLKNSEKEMVLKWRNNETIRHWMFDTKIISQKTHFNFIKTLESDITNQYFLVEQKNINIGVIYFNKINLINKSTYFGLYANPDTKVIGIGSILEQICISYAFDILKLKNLKLEVFEKNLKAMALYKKFNFKGIGEKTLNGKKVICMELNDS